MFFVCFLLCFALSQIRHDAFLVMIHNKAFDLLFRASELPVDNGLKASYLTCIRHPPVNILNDKYASLLLKYGVPILAFMLVVPLWE